MSARTPKPGALLYGEDGEPFVIVEAGTAPIEGLLALLEAAYGGDRFASDNPAILAAAADARIVTWRSCTKAWREGENIEDDDWWSADGDGARQITVCAYEGSVHDLGDEARYPADAAGGVPL